MLALLESDVKVTRQREFTFFIIPIPAKFYSHFLGGGVSFKVYWQQAFLFFNVEKIRLSKCGSSVIIRYLGIQIIRK